MSLQGLLLENKNDDWEQMKRSMDKEEDKQSYRTDCIRVLYIHRSNEISITEYEIVTHTNNLYGMYMHYRLQYFIVGKRFKQHTQFTIASAVPATFSQFQAYVKYSSALLRIDSFELV